MAGYNYQYNSQYNPAFDNQVQDRNSIFWDAVSITSSDRNSIALSVYHSVPELNHDETAENGRIFKADKARIKVIRYRVTL